MSVSHGARLNALLYSLPLALAIASIGSAQDRLRSSDLLKLRSVASPSKTLAPRR